MTDTIYAICPITGGLYDVDDAIVQCLDYCTLRHVSPDAAEDMILCDRRYCDHQCVVGDDVSVGSETWCAHCADRYAVVSDHNGDRYPSNETVTVRVFDGRGPSYATETWGQDEAADEATECDHCGRLVYHRTRDNTVDVGGATWCYRCVDCAACTCDACGALHSMDDSISDQNGEGCYCCDDCVPPVDDDDDDDGVADYHSGKRRGFLPVGHGPAYFGIELEMVCTEDRSEVARRVRSTWGDVVASIERDGSLPSTGCELVTHPLDLASWRAFFGSDRSIRGAKSHDTDCCGLHVHLTRSAFSDLTWAKVALFLHDASNAEVLSRLFRRTPNGYCGRGLFTSTITSARIASQKGNGPRYRVVNFENDATVEIRWPRGSLKQTTILATIELCDAIVRYCAAQALSDVGDVTRFLAWLRLPSQSHYRALRNYCVDRGVCQPFRKPAPTSTPTFLTAEV